MEITLPRTNEQDRKSVERRNGDIEMREEILRMEHICCMDEGVLELDYLKMKAVIAVPN